MPGGGGDGAGASHAPGAEGGHDQVAVGGDGEVVDLDTDERVRGAGAALAVVLALKDLLRRVRGDGTEGALLGDVLMEVGVHGGAGVPSLSCASTIEN